MKTLTVAGRFCGPPGSANGGYFAGLVAALSTRTLTVRLMKPPPLEAPLQIIEAAEGLIEVMHGADVVGQGRPGRLELLVPTPPAYLQALDASLHYTGFTEHAFPRCFVCGPERTRGDGLRVFAGPLATPGQVAAAWTPDSSLDAGDGKVRPEFMSAAMDCPGYFAAAGDRRGVALLGEFTAHIDRCVRVDEPCIVLGWRIASNGRKHEVGTALFDADGDLCGRARALWIEPRSS